MQRWVKDSDELAKFDMIKKGNWVRVRGRIENNPFTHSLTMNVPVSYTHLDVYKRQGTNGTFVSRFFYLLNPTSFIKIL